MTGTLEALLATPASASLVIVGSASYDILGSIAYAIVTLLIAVIFFGLELEIGWDSLLAIVTGLPSLIVLFAALGVAVAAFTIVFKQVTAVLGLVSTGLALLGGVYFPIEVLPEPLETIAEWLPFTWALDVLRAALLGGEVEVAKIAGLIACASVAMPLSLKLFVRARTGRSATAASPSTDDRRSQRSVASTAMNDRYRLRDRDIAWRQVRERSSSSTRTSTYLSINQSGAFLWQRLVLGSAPSELAAALATAYQLDEVAALKDATTFLERVVSLGLVEAVNN